VNVVLIEEPSMTKIKPRYTRKQLPDYIEQKHGFRPPLSSLNKLAMQGRLVPDAFYGKTQLYTPETADKLASELLSDRRTNLRINPEPPQAV
jgi:hypothetical protein